MTLVSCSLGLISEIAVHIEPISDDHYTKQVHADRPFYEKLFVELGSSNMSTR